MADVNRYGAGELDGDYWWVRVSYDESLGAEDLAVQLYIDGLGRAKRVAVAKAGVFTPEEIAELPSKGEAIALHLSRAFDRAEANRKAWLRHRESEPPPEPQPKPLDPATRRFTDDSNAIDLSLHPRWRR